MESVDYIDCFLSARDFHTIEDNLSQQLIRVLQIPKINGGKKMVGIDHTIIDVTKDKINILRKGYINKKKIKKLGLLDYEN